MVVFVRTLVIPQIFTRPRDPCTEHCGRFWLLRCRPHPVPPSWTSKCWKATLPTQWGQRSCSGRDVSVHHCGVNRNPWNSTIRIPRMSYRCSLDIQISIISCNVLECNLTRDFLVMGEKWDFRETFVTKPDVSGTRLTNTWIQLARTFGWKMVLKPRGTAGVVMPSSNLVALYLNTFFLVFSSKITGFTVV